MKYVLYLKHCILAPIEPVFAYALLGACTQLEVSDEFLPLEKTMRDMITFYEVGVVPEDGPQAIRMQAEIINLNKEYKKVHMVPAFERVALMRIPKVFEHFFRPVSSLTYKLRQLHSETTTPQSHQARTQ